MRAKIFDIAKFIIGWPISVISIIFLLKFFPSSADTFSRLRTINWLIILLSVFFFQLYFFLRGFIWREILKQKGYKLPLKKTLFLWAFSELKRYTPGNIWSFLGRLVLFNREGIKNKDIIHSLVIESEIFIVSSILVSLFCINFLFTILPLPSFKDYILTQPLIFFFVITIILLFVFNKKLWKRNIFPNLNPLQILNFLFLSSLSLLSFGAGTYFAGASIFFLDPNNFLRFVSFFVFALLIGYLSIITPMGLGVREGAITAVLSKIIPLSSATFISIFARIIFVMSEAIFLTLSWIFFEVKNRHVSRMFNFISNHKEEFLLGLFILSYFIYFTTASFLRYDAFYTGRFDLGNMDQTVWNTIHGRIFELTNPNGTDIISRLSFHADFILVLISPLYWVWSNPKILLLLQTLVVSTGAIFIYLISQQILRTRKISLILSLAFLLNPAVEHANLYDFHPVVLATTFLLASFYFLIKKKYFFLIFFLILSGLCKENIWIITSLFGLYLFVQKKIKLGILVFFLSLFVFFILVWIVIPKVAGSQHFALSYYSEFGDSPTKIINGVLTSPLKTLKIIFQKDQLIYIQQLFQPLGFLPILSPFYLFFSFPSLFIDLLSNNSQLHKIYYQYSASITPFLFIATIYSLKYLKKIAPSIPMVFYAFFILFNTIFSAYQYGPLIGAKNPNVAMFTEHLENERLIDKFLSRIPKRYSVAATNEVGSHLSHRQKIFTLPLGINEADIIILLARTSIIDPVNLPEKKIVDGIIKEKKYFIVYRDDQFIVFKKKGLRKSFFYF